LIFINSLHSLVVVASLALFSGARDGGTVNTAGERGMCVPLITRAIDHSSAGPFVVGDKFVKQGDFKTAAKVYYQIMQCDNPRLHWGIDLNTWDVLSQTSFAAAVAKAARGDFRGSVQALRKMTMALPEFSEGRFLTGVFEWADGDRVQARRDWTATITGPRMAIPPDAAPSPLFNAARELLEWSKGK
jgi:hypothetical protein